MKILPVGAELLHAEGNGRTDRQTNLRVTFRNFANTPKNAYSTLDGRQRLFGILWRRSEDVQKNLKEMRWKRGGVGVGGRNKQQAALNTAGNEFSE